MQFIVHSRYYVCIIERQEWPGDEVKLPVCCILYDGHPSLAYLTYVDSKLLPYIAIISILCIQSYRVAAVILIMLII